MEELRQALINSIELNGRVDEETVGLSQQLDLIIVEEQKKINE